MVNIELLLKNPELAEQITFSLKGNDLIRFAKEMAASIGENSKVPKVAAPDPDILLTVDEAAEFLKVSRVTLWSWEKKGILVPSKIGNLVRYRKSDIISAMEKRSSK